MEKEIKRDLIHIRIEPTVKEKSERIFDKLGINMSYAVSLFLNQVASIIGSTGGNGEISEQNQKIIHLYCIGDIDYETAVFAIKRNLKKEI